MRSRRASLEWLQARWIRCFDMQGAEKARTSWASVETSLCSIFAVPRPRRILESCWSSSVQRPGREESGSSHYTSAMSAAAGKEPAAKQTGKCEEVVQLGHVREERGRIWWQRQGFNRTIWRQRTSHKKLDTREVVSPGRLALMRKGLDVLNLERTCSLQAAGATSKRGDSICPNLPEAHAPQLSGPRTTLLQQHLWHLAAA